MNAEQLKGNWHQLKGEALEQWGRLTDDDIDKVLGEREKLVGKIQERYGLSKEAAEHEVNVWSVKFEQ
ncbi:CsbD family protein [Gilvimarinus xylanilyticus]|uniref:CsbD family protein n=1 Tax=Gilvimarinus xylanilyticus TaxID=2944139 RepID=A0A9X2HX31_9GAMM|nr:CsbD family protein [Gilvimarinus xylanilyticus]MCP8899988.1 CsbD family protein [Gilvimarinus xylanilyticus]